MSRRRKHAEHGNHERWLVSYADFITLLFAFFVVMFSTAQVDERKVGALSLAIQVAFQELGVFPASNSRMPLSTTRPLPPSEVQMVENAERTTTLGRLVSPAEGSPSDVSPSWDVNELQRELQEALAPEIERREVAIKVQGDSLLLSLREIGFFDSGAAKVRPESEAPLARIAEVLARRPQQLRIEGHTDNVPIHTPLFDTNWELSTARATEITKTFILRHGIAPARLSAAGYAEFHPVADNETPAGRALNRRVDIVILAPSPLPESGAPAAPLTAPAPPSVRAAERAGPPDQEPAKETAQIGRIVR